MTDRDGTCLDVQVTALRQLCFPLALLVIGLILASGRAQAQKNVVTIDASAPEEPVKPVLVKAGTARNPAGHTLEVNSRSLLLDGKPWLPVMGELHYSRVPEVDWEPAILKMKSAGVNIIATYVIWIHHEQNRGSFDWTGNKDLRRFAELCAKHGMYFYPRLGPWAHAEVRNGGLPDWVAAQPHTRENNPEYLAEVKTFYDQIGQQLRGLYWKDGGPIIGVQIENEYRAVGPGKGADHIRTLKAMARDAGMDVPLYTVTGWDSAAIPLDAALPVFGGYPDAPWDGSPKPLPPPEVYAFRFDNRAGGNMGAIGGNGQGPASAYAGTPFLTAEVGGGIQDTYFRRPVVSADDIAAMLPVMLGSGANLLGYYMFYGGRNPEGGAITLQESQRTGYPTDVPVKSYDFQAPISNNGEERESLRRLKLVHYFLNDFGEQLAPMTVRRPSVLPAKADDLSVPRVAARTRGNSGFVFINNYTRGAVMPGRAGFQVQLRLPEGTLNIPQEPITIASGAYGIWPVNFDVHGVCLRYSTAQLINRLDHGKDTYMFFFAIPGVPAEFVLNASRDKIQSEDFEASQTIAGLRLRAHKQSGQIVIQGNGGRAHLVLLPRDEAEDLWRVGNGKSLMLTKADVFSNEGTTQLQQQADPVFRYSMFHANAGTTSGTKQLFTPNRSAVPSVNLRVAAERIREAGPRAVAQVGPKVAWRKDPIAMAPDEKDFNNAGAWKLMLLGDTRAPQLANVLLRIRYQGDVARLSQSNVLLDDDFWNGLPWSVGVREVALNPLEPLTLQVLPLRKDAPMFLQQRSLLTTFPSSNQIGDMQSAEAIPIYKVNITNTTQ